MELLKTKYPVVLLSGFNNYDKIIEQTKFAGLKKLMEEQTPAFSLGYTDALGTIDHNAAQACETVKKVLKQSGCEKVNLIGISRGGLDARKAARMLGSDKVASVSTIVTPHTGGSPVFDEKIKGIKLYLFAALFKLIALKNHEKSDPVGALKTMDSRVIAKFNEENPNVPGVKYHSYGFVMTNEHSDEKHAKDYLQLKALVGDNDSLLPVSVMEWTDFELVRSYSPLGISHHQTGDLDMVINDEARSGPYDTLAEFYRPLLNKLAREGC